MSSTNCMNNYAVCIKMCELIDQMEQTKRSRLSVGDLVQIRKVYHSDCDRHIIQVFDREAQCFRRALYLCENDNLCEIPSNMWPFIHDITEGSVIKVRMALTGERHVIVNLQVKFFGEIPVGGDQFYGLQMMPTRNLTQEIINELNKTYVSPTLSLIIMRADKLILNLVVKEETDEPARVTPSTHRTEKTIYITDPDKKAYDFLLLPSTDNKSNDYNPSQSQEQSNIPNVIRQMIKNRTSNLSDEQECTLGDPKSNIKIFVLPKVPAHEKSCNADNKISRKIHRQSSRECKNNCFGCGKNEEALIQFNCQHIFCSGCLMNTLKDHNFGDLYCPYKNRNYNCRYKITDDDVQHIFDIENGNLNKKRNSTKSKTLFYQCTSCQFITKTDGQTLYQCTNCLTSINNQKDHDYEGIPSRPAPNPHKTLPPPVPTRALSVTETWSCTYCEYNENRIDSTKCVICYKTNDKLIPKTRRTNDYYDLLELEENDTFIPNSNQFYCVFCDQTIAPDNGVILRSCLHNVCLKCIVSYIGRQDQLEIKCPHSMCTYPMQNREIKSFITSEAYANLLEKSLNIGKMNLENGYQCCLPGCKGFWVFDNVNVKYICPQCNTENCIPCKSSHPGVECSVFKAQPK